MQPFAELHHNSSGSMFAIDSGTLAASAAAATAVAELPWHLLPASLMSLSLSGFVGLQTESIQALASAAPSLRCVWARTAALGRSVAVCAVFVVCLHVAVILQPALLRACCWPIHSKLILMCLPECVCVWLLGAGTFA